MKPELSNYFVNEEGKIMELHPSSDLFKHEIIIVRPVSEFLKPAGYWIEIKNKNYKR